MKLSRGLIEASFKDSSGGGTSIISKKAGEIARSMGLAPSEAEVTHFVKSVGPQCDLNSFVRFCDSISHPEDTYENLVQFFLLYDIKVS
ncbi:uncharacterized protein CMU_020610 [Cryptosporidium muris RN66]|uniref:Uncharacterized protein n=1 Tax=Cryptosporidium muris (strain RN66) TaxID=441375 RepID=B6AJ80_CRYMR|nr:uncharacterized protein CMU_020610 [Cryptosporidium muris RN66]EEA08317.1 hypothetical protein, conserved [Cryptosporidium muris RN66]|eukprot:XP_002142666.1 hypothetical protein [Cryptosporidium muris RN66]